MEVLDGVGFEKSISGAVPPPHPRCSNTIRRRSAPDRFDPDCAEPGHRRLPRIF